LSTRSNLLPDRRRILRFGIVGLVNTALGYGVILAGLALGWGDFAANAAGYAVGLCAGFLLNRDWTFRSGTRSRKGTLRRYGLVFMVAYGANLIVLALARSLGHVGSPIAQLVGLGTYSTLFYLGSAHYVFAVATDAPIAETGGAGPRS